jgi:hypothetical protein
MFTVAGIAGVVISALAMVSKPYRRLRAAEAEAMAAGDPDASGGGTPIAGTTVAPAPAM